MTRARGHVLQRATAAYLTRWWPHAESVPNGRPGRDILGTPGVWWEVKTSFAGTSARAVVQETLTAVLNSWPANTDWPPDATPPADVPVVVYWPPGVGERRPDQAICLMPLPELMRLLVDAGYAPPPKENQ